MAVPKSLADALAEQAKGLDFTGIKVYTATFVDGEELTLLCKSPPAIEKTINVDDATGEATPSFWVCKSPIFQKIRSDKVLSIVEVIYGIEKAEEE